MSQALFEAIENVVNEIDQSLCAHKNYSLVGERNNVQVNTNHYSGLLIVSERNLIQKKR